MSKSIRNVLVVNAGSSSLKFMLFNMETETMLAKGQVERIGIENSLFTYETNGFSEKKSPCEAPNHTAAIELVCNALIDANKGGCLSSFDDIDAVGHRTVHGGEKFSAPALLTDEVIAQIRDLIILAPLHNPASLQGIEGCKKVLPNVPHVGIFDTAFHQTMPEESYRYGLPTALYEKHGVRKYGFHGTSHKFVTQKAAEILGKPLDETNVITCHLGNGSSISAIKNGKCFDTSMGMTPLAGVMMGTRSGDFDPAIILFLLKQGYTPEQIDAMVNKEAGVLAMAGNGSSDMRDLVAARDEQGSKEAKLAMDRLVHSYTMYVGGYIALLGRVDAIIMTGGIGENSDKTREALLDRLAGLGIKYDHDKNVELRFGKGGLLSTEDSTIPVYVVPTNEELMIARETFELLSK
ncbi:MAG: acetate kinase [bacterium]|nr:acetate kinase [bacterium]MDO5462361.1 acetate kinase [bacterium]